MIAGPRALRARRVVHALAGILLVALGALPWGCRRAARPPNVVLIVVDTLRADRLGSYGNQRALTPFLDALATRAVRFRNAYANSSWTNPSVTTLFTARYPSQHQVRDFGSVLASDETTLAQRLAAAGYVTAGFSANPQLAGAHGYGKGFGVWQTFPSDKLRAPELREACVAWLDRAWKAGGERPLFLFLQFMDPHAPYEPPAAFRERFAGPDPGGSAAEAANRKLTGLRWHELSAGEIALLASLYDAEVAALDGELGRLFADLEVRGVLADAVVVVTSDHGEEFFEHRVMGHGMTLYDPVLRVPLLVAAPGVAAGTTVDPNVALVDVAPTVLALVRQPPEPRFAGRSVLPLLFAAGGPWQEGDVIVEVLHWGEGEDWRQHRAGIVRSTMKLLLPAENLVNEYPPAVYDLARDPGETSPYRPELDATAGILQAALQARLSALGERQTAAPIPGALDAAERERLRALGYVQ